MNNFWAWVEGAYDNRSGAAFWGNVGAGILPIAVDTGEWLVPFRSDEVNEPNTWGVWGGKLDDEHVMDVRGEAQREFMEETEYHGQIVLHPAYVFKTPQKGANGQPVFVFHNFLAEIERGNWSPTLNWETERFAWVKTEQLVQLRRKHFGLEALLKNSGQMIEALSEKYGGQ